MVASSRPKAVLPALGAAAGVMLLSQGFVSSPPQGRHARVGAVEERVVAEQSQVQIQLASQGASSAAQPSFFAGAAVMVAGAAGLAVRRRTAASKPVSVSPQALPKSLEGTGGPFGKDVWDPAGLMNGRSEEQILYWRAVELKHCRVAMLAVLGWLHVSGGYHPIGDAAAGFRVSNDPLVNVTQTTMGGMWQLIFTIMVLEWVQTVPCPPPKDKPWDVLGWDEIVVEDGEFAQVWKDKQLQELNNGRLAMFGIVGLIAQDAATGDWAPWIHQPNFGQANPYDWRGEPPFDFPPLFPLAPMNF